MALDKDDLEKLSPEERIKKLKEIEDERKKDLEETESLIEKTKAEIERNKDIPDIEVPALEPVDISAMFEAPEGLEAEANIPGEEEEEPVKYNVNEDYVARDLHATEEIPLTVKLDETVKYESEASKADTSASKSVLKNIKKYTSG